LSDVGWPIEVYLSRADQDWVEMSGP